MQSVGARLAMVPEAGSGVHPTDRRKSGWTHPTSLQQSTTCSTSHTLHPSEDPGLDPHERAERLRHFTQRCREEGLSLTAQRRVVLECVYDLDNHPTADAVFAAAAARMPEISRTTVYRILERMARIGVITKTCHPGRVVRFDPRPEIHHHLICMRCDRVVDFFDERLDALVLPDTSDSGFSIEDFRVQLRGICDQCRESEERS